MKALIQKIIISLVAVGVLYFAYNMFFGSSNNDDVLISGTNNLSARNLAEVQVLGKQITQALVQIESLSLDRSIFENSIFNSLIDRGESIAPEPIGRSNPFAPLGENSGGIDTNITLSEAEQDDSESDSEEEQGSGNFGDLGL